MGFTPHSGELHRGLNLGAFEIFVHAMQAGKEGNDRDTSIVQIVRVVLGY